MNGNGAEVYSATSDRSRNYCTVIWAALVLLVVIGFPRIYATELPMALLLVPFYFVGFLRFQAKNCYFLLMFSMLFVCWLLVGVAAFLMGDGTTMDISFHLIVSSKLWLNVFFGYVIYTTVKENNAALLIWLLIQVLVVCVSMMSHEFYQFLLGFISPRSASVFQHIFGLRALGFGLYHVDGALTLVIATYYYLLIAKPSLPKTLLLVVMLPISMAVARSAIVAYVIFSMLRRGIIAKLCLCAAVLMMTMLSLIVSQGPLYEATEIFRNFLNQGELRSDSVSALANMYVLPDNLETYMLGVGKYFDSDSSGLKFYMGTDVGYLRVLFYSGVGSVLLFVLLNVSGLVSVLGARTCTGSYDTKAFAVALACLFIIVNFKGLQVISIFAFVLCFYASDSNKQSVQVTP